MSEQRIWIRARCPKCGAPTECTAKLATLRRVYCPCGRWLAKSDGVHITFRPSVAGSAVVMR